VTALRGDDGVYRIVHPVTIPVQTAPTLEAARKLALNAALWTLGTSSPRKSKPKPEPESSESNTE
jgi:hypothetical protein